MIDRCIDMQEHLERCPSWLWGFDHLRYKYNIHLDDIKDSGQKRFDPFFIVKR